MDNSTTTITDPVKNNRVTFNDQLIIEEIINSDSDMETHADGYEADDDIKPLVNSTTLSTNKSDTTKNKIDKQMFFPIKNIQDSKLFVLACDIIPDDMEKMEKFIYFLDKLDVIHCYKNITLWDITEISSDKLDILLVLLRLIEATDQRLMQHFKDSIFRKHINAIMQSDEIQCFLNAKGNLQLVDKFIDDFVEELCEFARNLIRLYYPKFDLQELNKDLVLFG